MATSKYTVSPLGYVHGDEIRLSKRCTRALKGIEGFSHLIVLCWLDQAKPPKMQIRPKRSKVQPIGYLATRTPHRQNPISLTVVKLLKRTGNTLRVSGLDVWNATPVIDIKPYTPRDVIARHKIPGWVKLWDRKETDPLRKYSSKSV